MFVRLDANFGLSLFFSICPTAPFSKSSVGTHLSAKWINICLKLRKKNFLSLIKELTPLLEMGQKHYTTSNPCKFNDFLLCSILNTFLYNFLFLICLVLSWIFLHIYDLLSCMPFLGMLQTCTCALLIRIRPTTAAATGQSESSVCSCCSHTLRVLQKKRH